MLTTESKSIFICDNIDRDADGELTLAGRRLSPLAEKYGTPLYLYDENKIREKRKRNSIKEKQYWFNFFTKWFFLGIINCFRNSSNAYNNFCNRYILLYYSR